MSRWTIALVVAALGLGAGSGVAQDPRPDVPEDQRAQRLAEQSLNGPRFGITLFTGEVAEYRSQTDLPPTMTQFGWQFERQLVSLSGGNRVLTEWVLLLGGFEQKHHTVSAAWLAGYRLSNGFELGVGPNVSFTSQSDDATTSMILAAGATVPFGDIFVPFNAAMALAEGGPRITVLTGWIVG